MMLYAGLDVSDKSTHLCVVDGEGAAVLLLYYGDSLLNRHFHRANHVAKS
jgi:hypothetical protein